MVSLNAKVAFPGATTKLCWLRSNPIITCTNYQRHGARGKRVGYFHMNLFPEYHESQS
jgi:hypothetical protein